MQEQNNQVKDVLKSQLFEMIKEIIKANAPMFFMGLHNRGVMVGMTGGSELAELLYQAMKQSNETRSMIMKAAHLFITDAMTEPDRDKCGNCPSKENCLDDMNDIVSTGIKKMMNDKGYQA